jgi:hypothetical protein
MVVSKMDELGRLSDVRIDRHKRREKVNVIDSDSELEEETVVDGDNYSRGCR